MWNTSNNDNFDVGKSGGGFVTSPGMNSSQIGSSQNESKKFKVDKQQNVIPCTLAQIQNLSQSEDVIKVGSVSAHVVTIVGLVVSVEEMPTKVMFRIDDMTSEPFLVQLWIGDDEEMNSDSRAKVIENSFVRVTGTLRSVAGLRQMIAFKVLTIKDANEITMHMLEIMHSRMAISMMDSQPSAMDTSAMDTSSSRILQDISAKPISAGGASVKGLTQQQDMVLQSILAINAEDGANVSYMCKVLPSLTRATIKNIIEFLSNEGHIYSTIDDEHFRATDI